MTDFASKFIYGRKYQLLVDRLPDKSWNLGFSSDKIDEKLRKIISDGDIDLLVSNILSKKNNSKKNKVSNVSNGFDVIESLSCPHFRDKKFNCYLDDKTLDKSEDKTEDKSEDKTLDKSEDKTEDKNTDKTVDKSEGDPKDKNETEKCLIFYHTSTFKPGIHERLVS